MSQRTLVVVRHGQTDWNLEHRYQGHEDIPLNTLGIQQSENIREELRDFDFDVIYSSPLKRAFETARVIVGDKSILTDWRLAEIHLGRWQGLTAQEIAERWPDPWQRWREDARVVTPEGGESMTELEQRVSGFLKDLQGRTILCVSHGMVIRMMDALIKGRIPADWHAVLRNGHAAIFNLDV